MTRLINLMIACYCLTAVPFLYATEQVRVVVIPFTIHSPDDPSNLKTEIPKAIGKHLREEGAVILEPDPVVLGSIDRLGTEGFRKIGIKSGADFVIWGSMTQLGDQFSVDIKMLESFSETPPIVLFNEGESIETLPGIVQKASRRLGMKIFKQTVVATITVTGNRRIESDAIERVIQTKPGGVFSAKDLSQDLRAVYNMGYFDDVRIESEDGPKGKTVRFLVKEKPTIRVIRFKGNQMIEDEELKENLSLSTGSILNIFKLEKNVKRIETLYKDKNYHNVQVSYTIEPLKNEQADLKFIIEEGDKILIKEIAFEGNRAYPDRKLKKLMKTSEKSLLSWITSAGDLSKEDLDRDVDSISAFYNNNGYIKSKVGEPLVEYKPDGIYITIKVDEGPRFKVGRVDITGDIILTKEELVQKLKIDKNEFYNRELVRNDVLSLMDLYSDQGYAYADIIPKTDQDPDDLVVHITYTISKGKEVYFEKIIIDGNTITRDKVIRRELKIYEQELYSGVRLKEGIRNLHRLEFFEDVKVNTERGKTDDSMILKINVTEKPTGTFSFGGGYSNDENVFGMASISQRNLFGRAQTLQLKGQVGGTTNRFTLSFVEPWLLDMPLTAGFDIYNWDTEYDEYDKDAVGGRLRFSYPVYHLMRASFGYTYEVNDITNIEPTAASSIRELEGENTTNSLNAGLRYDSRDRVFNPTHGSAHSIGVEYAGFGGDIAFTKYTGETGWYFPLFWETVGYLHGKIGFASQNSGGILPDYEKFYLGGIDSMRGFELRGIHLTDEDGAAIGGEKFIQFNIEYLIPISKEAGVVGVLFFDTGNVYASGDNFDLGDLRESVGYGFRWYSPVGPIRIANGYIIDPRPGEDDSGRWEFSMGQAF